MENTMNKTNSLLTRRGALKLAAGSAAASFIGMPAIVRGATTQLTVANGGGAVGDAFKVAAFDTFEKKYGIKIISAPYLEGAKLKLMVENKAVDIDVADTDVSEAAPLAVQGLLEEIDYSIVPRAGMRDGADGKHWVQVYVTACVLGWNTDAEKKNGAPKNWKDVFDPNFKGQRAFWKSAAQTMECAALGAGQTSQNLYPMNIDTAFDALTKIRKNTTWWTSGAQSAQLLAGNEVDFGMFWNGRVDPIKLQGGPVDYTFENSLHTPGEWVCPKGGPNKDTAMKFIAHCVDPEVQAEFAKHIPYGPTVKAALDLLPADLRARMPTSPENSKTAIRIDDQYWLKEGGNVWDRFNTWIASN